MKKLLYIILSVFFFSCSDSLEELNINENLPTEARPGFVLPGAVFKGADDLSRANWQLTDQIMQFHTVSDFVNFNIYDFSPGATSWLWNNLYITLGNVQLIIDNSQDDGLEAYLGAAYVLKAFYAATITDLWIDAPLSEASQGRERIIQPSYDSQEQIYTEALSLLSKANTLFSGSPGFIQGGDVIYNGDVAKWQKFANSLRLRYLLRLSGVSSVNAPSEIAAILNNPLSTPVFESTADDAVYDFSGVSPNIPNILALTSLADLTVLNEAYVDYLQPLGDPRLDFFARKPTNAPAGPHVGIQSGIFDPSNQRDDVSASRLDLFFDNPGLKDFAFITFSEVEFIRAEAALNGWTIESAQVHYEKGVSASMSFWGLSLPVGYFANPDVTWNGTLDRLMQQKWASFYNISSIEAWGEYKRTGLPVLQPGPANATNGVVPTRFLYPLDEQSLNNSNYKTASQRIGGDINIAAHWYQ